MNTSKNLGLTALVVGQRETSSIYMLYDDEIRSNIRKQKLKTCKTIYVLLWGDSVLFV